MKKIFYLFMITTALVIGGCEGPEGPRGPQGPAGGNVEAEVFELINVDFSLNNNGEYTIFRNLTLNILDSDVVLIYRMAGTIDAQTPIWQLLPRTLFLNEGELDYDYDFSAEDFTIYAGGTYNLALTPEYINDQVFRIVIIPGQFSDRPASVVDFSDYNAVIEAYNLQGKPIRQIN